MRTGTNLYNQSYAYDANDNRTAITSNGVSTTAIYDAANQLVSQGSTSYSYDRNGNMVGYGANSLSYDAQNRWTGGTVNNQSVMFDYDGRGRRVSRTVGPGRTDYWYDQSGLTLETGAANTAFLRGPDVELLSRTRKGYVTNYGTDSLGSITALTDTTGALVGSYAYDPWGEEIGNTAGGWYNPYRYTGTYLDADTSLYQMGARYYQPGAGRFTQVDPVNGSNWGGRSYDYTGGNPVNYTDPTGLYHTDATSNCPGKNGISWRWWGVVKYFDACATRKIIHLLNGGSGISALTAVILEVARYLPHALAAAAAAALYYLGATYISWLADYGRGIYVAKAWGGSPWIWHQ